MLTLHRECYRTLIYAHYMKDLNYWILSSEQGLSWVDFLQSVNRLVNSDSSMTITLLKYNKSSQIELSLNVDFLK